jgi:hypothetical protein
LELAQERQTREREYEIQAQKLKVEETCSNNELESERLRTEQKKIDVESRERIETMMEKSKLIAQMIEKGTSMKDCQEILSLMF